MMARLPAKTDGFRAAKPSVSARAVP